MLIVAVGVARVYLLGPLDDRRVVGLAIGTLWAVGTARAFRRAPSCEDEALEHGRSDLGAADRRPLRLEGIPRAFVRAGRVPLHRGLHPPWRSFATTTAAWSSLSRPARHTDAEDTEAVDSAPTTRVIHPGEGGYDEALAEWDRPAS